MNAKVAIVTGASSGIGREVARGLEARGFDVVPAARRAEGDAYLDLASFASIRAFADRFRAKHDRLHLLVNNAGIHTARRERTEDGIERTLQVNHVGPFLLTHELLPLLRAGAPSRIVNVASEAHRGGRLSFDNLQGERRWSGIRAYTRSKLANIAFTYELARRLDASGVTANVVHPGSVRSGWARGKESGLLRVATWAAAPFLISPQRSAEYVLRVATDPALDGVTGKYFVKGVEARSSTASYREDDWRRLWDESRKLAGIVSEP